MIGLDQSGRPASHSMAGRRAVEVRMSCMITSFMNRIRLPIHGVRVDYSCASCRLACSIIRSDRPALRAGGSPRLIQRRNRIWLQPDDRADLP